MQLIEVARHQQQFYLRSLISPVYTGLANYNEITISVMTQDITLPLEGVMFQQTYIHQQQGHQDCQLLNLSRCQCLACVAYCCTATD